MPQIASVLKLSLSGVLTGTVSGRDWLFGTGVADVLFRHEVTLPAWIENDVDVAVAPVPSNTRATMSLSAKSGVQVKV